MDEETPIAKLEHLGLRPGTYIMEGENQLLQAVLRSPHAPLLPNVSLGRDRIMKG